MIHIFFVPGMFGSMLEMALRAFTALDGTLEPRFLSDGSSHNFKKQHHPLSHDTMPAIKDVKITTPIYPWRDGKLKDILQRFEHDISSWTRDHKILIHAPDIRWAEINLLFQYHKISVSLGLGLNIFGGELNNLNIQNWNPNYTSFAQMAKWEWREWFSIFYPQYVQEWIDAPQEVSEDFLILTNQEVLELTKTTLLRVFDFCGLSALGPLDDFVADYTLGQTYIVQEYDRIIDIVDSVVQQESFSWEPLSIVGEAVLQHHFRCLGFEWYCDGLDVLPTNSKDFQNLIYQPTGNLHA